MKKLKRRLMTGLLAVAMMFSNMPGMGMLVANAAVDAQVNTVTAKVVDSNEQPVKDVIVSLMDYTYNPTGSEYKSFTSDSEGKGSFTFTLGKHDDGNYKVIVKSGQSVVCDTEYSIVVENGGYISTINGEAVTEVKELVFKVREDESAPQITSIEAPTSMAKDTTSVDVKIVGKNLPESFNCRLQAKYDDGQGGFATTGGFKTVTAKEGGSASERTVTIAAPYCKNPVSWEVTVQIPEYSITKTAEIAVATEPEQPTDPEQPNIDRIEAPASMAKDTTSVDVKIVGKNLPESFRCRLQAKYDDGMGGFATTGNFAEVTAKEGGSASERTVTIAAPYCKNPVSWEVTVQIPEYSITKTAEIAVATEPVITEVVAPASLDPASKEVSLTVKGSNLPDKLLVKSTTYWKDGTVESPFTDGYKEISASGTPTERTITVQLKAVSKTIVRWEIAVKPSIYSGSESIKTVSISPVAGGEAEKTPSITGISFDKTVFDSKGGTVKVTLDGENLDVIDLDDITAKVFLAGNATATDIPVSVARNDSGKPVLTYGLAANDTEKTQNYILKVYYKSSEVIASTDRENKQVVAVLPAGASESDQTLGAMTISAVNSSSGDDLKNAVAEVSKQVGSLKVEIRLYGTNLDNKRTKIRAIDENGILWPVYDVPECDGTWRFIAIAGTDKNGIFGQGNSQLVELLPPRYAGTNKRYTIQVSIDGENWITEDTVTLTVNNESIQSEPEFRDCGAEDIKTLTINYVDESGNPIAESDVYKGYDITMVQQFGIAPKTIEGYTLVEEKNPSFPEWMEKAKDSYSYVYKADNAGGGTSGGGTPAPSEPENSTITNSGGASGSNVVTNVNLSDKTTVADGKAEVKVDSELGDKIVENAVNNASSTVVINASAAANAAETAVSIPAKTYNDILAKTDAETVSIKTDAGTVVLDKKALVSVVDKAGTEGDVKLIVETNENNKNKVEVSLKIETSNGTVSDFKGGNVTVTVPVSSELAGKKLVCVYIDDNGKYTKMGGELSADKKSFSFSTGHFSTYAILEEAEADAVIDEQNKAEAPAVKVAKASVKLKAYKGGKLKVTASAKNATGYRVYYKKSSWKKYKTYTKGKVKTLNKTFKKLAKGKYTVKVKAYHKAADGKVTWGTTSSAKKITVRK